MNFLPSKKLIGFVFGVLVIASILFFALSYAKQEKEISDSALTAVKGGDFKDNPLLRELTVKDRDGDGLYDWEEGLWKTDPDNPDTDGDGKSDNEEILSNENPLSNVPGSPLPTIGESVVVRSGTSESFETETDKLAQNFLKEYVSLKQGAGRSFDEATQDFLVRGLANSSLRAIREAKTFEKRDLVLAPDNTEASLRSYASAMGLALTRSERPVNVHEMDILEEALVRDNPEILKKLDPIIANYDVFIEDTLRAPVPPTLVKTHLSYVNHVSALRASIAGFQIMFDDPLLGASHLQNYFASAKGVAFDLVAIEKVFVSADITFSEDESGYALLDVI